MSYTLAERAFLNVAHAAYGRMMAMPKRRDFYRVLPARVTRVKDVAPRVRRLTISGPALADYTLLGADEYLGLVMAPAGRTLKLPAGTKLDIRREIASMPDAVRPAVRWYTVREHRPEQHEIDLDIVIHEEGPGGAFLARVQPGEAVGVREGTGGYRGLGDGERQLIVADETAFPALSAIADLVRAKVGETDRIEAIVEAPSEAFLAPVDAPFPITRAWRGEGTPGSAVMPLVEERSVPSDLAYAWTCGEQRLATGVRRHLVKTRGVDRRRVTFSGYWRLGAARE